MIITKEITKGSKYRVKVWLVGAPAQHYFTPYLYKERHVNHYLKHKHGLNLHFVMIGDL